MNELAKQVWGYNSEFSRPHIISGAPLGLINLNDNSWTLMACAPEMLRMLLDYEWSSTHCLKCGGQNYAGHKDGCELVTLLKKAGVQREPVRNLDGSIDWVSTKAFLDPKA